MPLCAPVSRRSAVLDKTGSDVTRCVTRAGATCSGKLSPRRAPVRAAVPRLRVQRWTFLAGLWALDFEAPHQHHYLRRGRMRGSCSHWSCMSDGLLGWPPCACRGSEQPGRFCSRGWGWAAGGCKMLQGWSIRWRPCDGGRWCTGLRGLRPRCSAATLEEEVRSGSTKATPTLPSRQPGPLCVCESTPPRQ